MITAASFSVAFDLPIGMDPQPIAERVERVLRDTEAERVELRKAEAPRAPLSEPDLDTEANGRTLPVVTYVRPRCPKCGCAKYRSRKRCPLDDQTSDAELRYVSCKECGAHFALFAE